MKLHILDTDILQLYQDGHPTVVGRVHSLAPGQRAISVVTVEEQMSGWYSQLRQAKTPERLVWAYRRLAKTVRFLSRVEIVDLEEAAVRRCEQLKKLKIRVRKMDLRIAATALESGAILVNRNLRDFEQVPGLQIEDWSK
jgi:tRNA(fMet)-specific endonuclease VapC